MRLSLIVAMAENRVIGIDNGLPWTLPADLQHFKRITMGKPIVMGRKTYESLGRPLPGRDNIVVSSNREFQAPGCRVVTSLDEALALAAGADEVMVIGGAMLFELALPRAERLYATLVHAEPQGDTWFPAFGSEWREVSRDVHAADERNEWPYTFLVYERSGGKH